MRNYHLEFFRREIEEIFGKINKVKKLNLKFYCP
jgi:hypothetical protein